MAEDDGSCLNTGVPSHKTLSSLPDEALPICPPVTPAFCGAGSAILA